MQIGKGYNNPELKSGKEGTTYAISNRCLIVRLNDELDHHNAVIIREKTDKLIERNHIKNVIFDFSGTDFMDSAGIGVIMGRYKKVVFMGGKIAVTGVGYSIDRIIRLSGLYKIIERYDTVESALQNLK